MPALASKQSKAAAVRINSGRAWKHLLSFQIGGRVQQKVVQAGDVVKQGQLLFALDPSRYWSSLPAPRKPKSSRQPQPWNRHETN